MNPCSSAGQVGGAQQKAIILHAFAPAGQVDTEALLPGEKALVGVEPAAQLAPVADQGFVNQLHGIHFGGLLDVC